MQVFGKISGSITGSGAISGSLSPPTQLVGELRVPAAIGVIPYEGDYELTPKAWTAQTLPTEGKYMTDNVTVIKIPYYETSNIYDGKTVFIAEDING